MQFSTYCTKELSEYFKVHVGLNPNLEAEGRGIPDGEMVCFVLLLTGICDFFAGEGILEGGGIDEV
jgi:hypothetical protein